MTKLNKKRGISDVVTTVLIILLALAAVVILWSFLRPTFTEAGTEITGQNACLSLNIAANSCIYRADPDGDPDTDDSVVDVSVERSSGDANLVGLKLLIDNANGREVIEDAFTGNLPNLYDIKTATGVEVTEVPTQVKVVGVISIDGKETDCAQSAPTVCS
jgi:hypothetical protein